MTEEEHINKVAEAQEFDTGLNKILGDYRCNEVALYLPKIKSLLEALEIGAGPGLMTELLAQKFTKLDFIEPADRYIENLKSITNKVFKTTFEEAEFDPGTQYNAIFICGVLEHVLDPISFLMKAEELLSDEGSIFITVPNARSLHRQIGKKLGRIQHLRELGAHDIAVGHRRYYTSDDLRREASYAGLYLEKVSGILLKPFPNEFFSKSDIPSDYIRGLYLTGKDLPDYCAEIFAVAKKSGGLGK